MRVLFVCSANVGRSQMAQAWYNLLTSTDDARSAAGTEKLREKYFNRPHPLIIQVMAELGINISASPITYLTDELVEDSDQVILMYKPKECLVPGLEYDPKVTSMHIEDPYKAEREPEEVTLARYRATRDEIYLKIELMLAGHIVRV